MSSAALHTRPARVGDFLHTVEELEALPELAIILADPEGRHPYADSRRLAMQRRIGYTGLLDNGERYAPPSYYWYPSWLSDWTPSSDEAVHRFGLGPFLVIWLPPGRE